MLDTRGHDRSTTGGAERALGQPSEESFYSTKVQEGRFQDEVLYESKMAMMWH